ncbi:hypothetical protein RHMOL_Rhmol10G0023600 [Rhododendron molle]|uniref:Uncharacterized protein n=1 Tax=Rhododendron molle TaxID=49168 RepID=A0ACC0LZV4_RHOML|nr:hypothetical protein RHMOL_Rhmol10G0023600 [Rhododendron molle]
MHSKLARLRSRNKVESSKNSPGDDIKVVKVERRSISPVHISEDSHQDQPQSRPQLVIPAVNPKISQPVIMVGSSTKESNDPSGSQFQSRKPRMSVHSNIVSKLKRNKSHSTPTEQEASEVQAKKGTKRKFGKIFTFSHATRYYVFGLSGHASPVESVTFNSAEVLVLAGASAGVVKLWDLEETKTHEMGEPIRWSFDRCCGPLPKKSGSLQICYHVLGLLHGIRTPIPRSMKDYIATPKPNGYQSLHTTVIPFLYETMFQLEVQTEKCRIKFNVTITDQTRSIDTAIFPEIAEQIYAITGDKIALPALGQSLAPEILHKLAEHKHGSITPKAYMYTYAGITQLKFNVHSMCTTADPQHVDNQEAIPALLPPTLSKGENPTMASPSQASPETPPAKKLKQTIT